MAMPSTALVSTSVMEAPTMVATVVPLGLASFSVIVVKEGVAGVRTGASLTAVTVILAVSVAVLKALGAPAGSDPDDRRRPR